MSETGINALWDTSTGFEKSAVICGWEGLVYLVDMATRDLGSPFFRQSGEGPGVVCLHSNASTSSQWKSLMNDLSDQFMVLASDALGAGKSPPWPATQPGALSQEVRLLSQVLEAAGDEFFLVGHSYGGAVALKVALEHPDRVKAIVLYEPTLFAVLQQESPNQPAFNEINAVVDDAVASIDSGDLSSAAERFIDYWMQTGSWMSMPDKVKGPIARSMRDVERWRQALCNEPTPLEHLSRIEKPILYMTGGQSPASSKGVARLLTEVLPQVESIEFDDLGHMAPVTHPQRVNPYIKNFLVSLNP